MAEQDARQLPDLQLHFRNVPLAKNCVELALPLAEANDQASGETKILLRTGSATGLCKSGREIVQLGGVNSKAVRERHVNSAASKHNNAVFARVDAAAAGGVASNADQHVREGSETPEISNRDSRSAGSGVHGAGHA
jgi:hypothetical protein